MNPTYDYVKFLPRNRIIPSTVQALLNSSYVTGLVGNNIYGYYTDDNRIDLLPSLSVYHGQLNSPDSYDRIVGTIIIDVYDSLDITRENTTQSVDTLLEVLRTTIQNPNFFEMVSLNQFDYNNTISMFQNDFDKNEFNKALRNYNPLVRYGIEYNCEQPTFLNPLEIGDCQRVRNTFKYWINTQAYEIFLELLGVNARNDPNAIVYPLWEQFNLNMEQIS